MNRNMNAFRRRRRTPLGRLLHDLARHDVSDDLDLRDQVMRAIQQHGADRARGDATERVWNLPAIDPSRQRRRESTSDTSEEHTMTRTSTSQHDELIPLQQRGWFREALRLAAATIIFAIIGAILVLVLQSGDPNDESSVPGAAPPTSTVTEEVTTTATANARRDAARQQLTALAAEQTSTEAASATANASLPLPGAVVATIEVDESPGVMAATEDSIWVSSPFGGTISRIDIASNTVVATVEVGGSNAAWIVAYDGQVWTTNSAEQTIVRIDPAANQVVQSIPFPTNRTTDAPQPSGLFIDETGLWVSDADGGRLVNIDPATGAIIGEVAMEDPWNITSGFGSLWVCATRGSAILRVDPVSRQILAEIDVEDAFTVRSSDDAVWVSGGDRSGSLTRIDPATNTVVDTIDTGLSSAHFILLTDEGIWAGGYLQDGIVRLDPTTFQPGQRIDFDNGNVGGIVEADGSIWVSRFFTNIVVRIDPAP